jgi:hypothetical protein
VGHDGPGGLRAAGLQQHAEPMVGGWIQELDRKPLAWNHPSHHARRIDGLSSRLQQDLERRSGRHSGRAGNPAPGGRNIADRPLSMLIGIPEEDRKRRRNALELAAIGLSR